MSDAVKKIIGWSLFTRAWSRLSMRERFLIYAMVFSSTIAAHVFLVAQPHEERRAALVLEADQATRLIQRITQLGQLDHGDSKITDTRPLPVLVADTAEEFDVSLSRLSERDSSVDLEITSLSFDILAQWLHALMNTYAVEIESLEITRTLEPGTVSARFAVSASRSGS